MNPRAAAPSSARDADARAREAAQTSFGRPLLLVAGAGTGKTAALVARIVAWSLGRGWEEAERALSERPRPAGAPAASRAPESVAARVLERVVAITFTEAAAAEMASRVADALSGIATGEPPAWILPDALPADEASRVERAAALLVALDRLVVCTIHAFCRRVLSRNPVEAGLHLAFAVDADG